MQIVIKSATIKGSLFLSYTFEQIDIESRNKITTNSDAPIHDDLRNAFKKFIPHFAFICEEVKDEELIKKAIDYPDTYLFDRDSAPEETFFKFKCTSFTITEKDGYEKVTITGAKQLENLNEIYFATPAMAIGDDEYKFHNELQELIEEIKKEVLAYMQGKTAPKAQLDMFGDEEEETTNADL